MQNPPEPLVLVNPVEKYPQILVNLDKNKKARKNQHGTLNIVEIEKYKKAKDLADHSSI